MFPRITKTDVSDPQSRISFLKTPQNDFLKQFNERIRTSIANFPKLATLNTANNGNLVENIFPGVIEQGKKVAPVLEFGKKMVNTLINPGSEVVEPALKKYGVDPRLAFGIGLGVDVLAPGPGEYGELAKGLDKTSDVMKGVEDLAAEARKYKSAEEFVKGQGKKIYHSTDSEAFNVFDSTKAVKGETYFNPLGDGLFLSKDKEFTRRFGKNTFEYVLPKDAKTKIITDQKFQLNEYPVAVKETLKKLGIKYDNLDLGDKVMINRLVENNPPIQALNEVEFLIREDIAPKFGVKPYPNQVKNIMQGIMTERNSKYDAVIYRSTDDIYGKADEIIIPKDKVPNLKTPSQLTDIWKKANQATPESSLINEAKKYKSADEFRKAIKDDVLFHGTGEPIKGDLRGGGYDRILWTTESPDVAQNYIRGEGSSGSWWTIEKSLSSDYPRKFIPRDEHMLGSYNKVYELMGYDPLTDYTVGRGANKPIDSWRITKNGKSVEAPTTEQAIDALKKVGYKIKDDTKYSTTFDIRSTFRDGKEEWLPPDFKVTGELYIFKGRNKLKIYDMYSPMREALLEPDYHKLDLFEKLQNKGYDGVRINDYAQSEKFGNLGHPSIGLFPSGIKKLEKLGKTKAGLFDWPEGMGVYDTKEYKDFITDIWKKANQVK